MEEIIENFLELGGKVNKNYLKAPSKGPVLVFYKRWFRGRNLKEAIGRALAA